MLRVADTLRRLVSRVADKLRWLVSKLATAQVLAIPPAYLSGVPDTALGLG